MIECGFYHGDCMDYLKELPDKSIDLAIVDPPYGDALQNEGGGGYYNRFGERFDRYKGGGWHGKQKYHLGASTGSELQKARRDMGLPEPAGDGLRGTTRQKNHSVGRSAETGIF